MMVEPRCSGLCSGAAKRRSRWCRFGVASFVVTVERGSCRTASVDSPARKNAGQSRNGLGHGPGCAEPEGFNCEYSTPHQSDRLLRRRHCLGVVEHCEIRTPSAPQMAAQAPARWLERVTLRRRPRLNRLREPNTFRMMMDLRYRVLGTGKPYELPA